MRLNARLNSDIGSPGSSGGRAPLSRRRRARCGAAMIETVLVLPVVLVVLLLVLGLGRSMMRWQQVSVMDRYEAWRQVAAAPGPSSPGQLNQAFLRNEAARIESVSDDFFPSEPMDAWRDGAMWVLPEAGWLADRVAARLPDGRRVRFETSFASDIPLESRLGLTGPLHHGHVRLNHEWKFVNALRHNVGADRWEPTGEPTSLAEPLRDRFLEQLDSRLWWMESAGNGVAGTVRELYMRDPRYRGPHIDLD